MKKLKYAGALLLLIVLTAGVVFIPQLISGQKEEQRLNEVVYRDYTASQRPKLTGEQVARLYCDRETDIRYNSSQNDGDAEKIREDAMYLTESLFRKEIDLCEPIVAFIEKNALSHSRSSSLILVDNQPTALHFVSCSAKGNDAVFEIVYEDKTKTVISFSADSPGSSFRTGEEMDQYAAAVASQLNSYFEEQLHLSRDEYYCTVEFSKVTETGNNGFTANTVIRCGIRQLDEKGK